MTSGLDSAVINQRLSHQHGRGRRAPSPPTPTSARPNSPRSAATRHLAARVGTGHFGYTNYLAFNPKVKPFDNPKVRQAISYAIDRTSRHQRGGRLRARRARHHLPAGPEGLRLHAVRPVPGGQDRRPGQGQGAAEGGGLPERASPSRSPTPTAEDCETSPEIATAVQDALKKAGITVKLQGLEDNAYKRQAPRTSRPSPASSSPTGAPTGPPAARSWRRSSTAGRSSRTARNFNHAQLERPGGQHRDRRDQQADRPRPPPPSAGARWTRRSASGRSTVPLFHPVYKRLSARTSRTSSSATGPASWTSRRSRSSNDRGQDRRLAPAAAAPAAPGPRAARAGVAAAAHAARGPRRGRRRSSLLVLRRARRAAAHRARGPGPEHLPRRAGRLGARRRADRLVRRCQRRPLARRRAGHRPRPVRAAGVRRPGLAAASPSARPWCRSSIGVAVGLAAGLGSRLARPAPQPRHRRDGRPAAAGPRASRCTTVVPPDFPRPVLLILVIGAARLGRHVPDRAGADADPARSSTTSPPPGSAAPGSCAWPGASCCPSLAAPVITYAAILLPSNIVRRGRRCPSSASACKPPTPSWGQMLSSADDLVPRRPACTCCCPRRLLFVTVLAFTVLGDGVRTALDPREASRAAGRHGARRARRARPLVTLQEAAS